MSSAPFLSISNRVLLCTIALSVSACAATKPITAFDKGRPIFTPEKYFGGHTHSWGVFENRSAEPTKTLTTVTDGHAASDGFHFEQDIQIEGGKTQHRSWLIHRVDAHHYTATGTGIVGVAQGVAYGNAFHLDFTIDALPGNPLGHLHMSQWMYLQDDGVTMVNRDTLTKAGVIVAQLTEHFHKDR